MEARLVKSVTNGSFVEFINTVIDADRRSGHYGQANKNTSARNSLLLFLASLGIDDIGIDDISQSLIHSYQSWMYGHGLKRNSTSCYMRALQSIYNRAIVQTGCQDHRPFGTVYRGVAKTRKRAASIDVVRLLQRADIRSALIEYGFNPNLKHFQIRLDNLCMARDWFLFSYCARGMSFVDMVYIQKQDVSQNIIYYKRKKTGQPMSVAISPMMHDIINRYAPYTVNTPYLLPIIKSDDALIAYKQYRTALRSLNLNLKMLARVIGTDVMLSSYVARHSWASHMYQQSQPIGIISQGLGHDSIMTTQIYIKALDDDIIHRANDEFLKNIFNRP